MYNEDILDLLRPGLKDDKPSRGTAVKGNSTTKGDGIQCDVNRAFIRIVKRII